MTLKTLKDIQYLVEFRPEGKEGVIPTGSYVRIWELRQEVIKHVKDLIKDRDLEDRESECAYLDGQIDWIKYFFNITEEDLE